MANDNGMDEVKYQALSGILNLANTSNASLEYAFWSMLNLGQLNGALAPAGGTTGQVLAKASNTDYDLEWVTGAGGGGASITGGSAVVDFGAFPGSNTASVAVTGQATILATSKATAYIKSDDTSVDHTANDHLYAPILMDLSCNTPTPSTGFTINAISPYKLTGKFTVRWQWVD